MAVALVPAGADGIIVLAASARRRSAAHAYFAGLHGVQAAEATHQAQLQALVQRFADERGHVDGHYFERRADGVLLFAGLGNQLGCSMSEIRIYRAERSAL